MEGLKRIMTISLEIYSLAQKNRLRKAADCRPWRITQAITGRRRPADVLVDVNAARGRRKATVAARAVRRRPRPAEVPATTVADLDARHTPATELSPPPLH